MHFTPASDGPSIVLVRHGETEWSRAGRHTSTTDIGLTERGEQQARRIGAALRERRFAVVLCSPRRRARETAALAGFADPIVDDDLVEWDYGALEGRTSRDISAQIGHPWSIWTASPPDPTPAETAAEIARRADAVIERLQTTVEQGQDAAVFSHAHFLRVLAARWLDLPPTEGARFALDAGGISELGFEHDARVVTRWNLPA
ncbi:histidine phosphatase family protein [Microbacterium protaetiae]|uniref:Histidine phosphatase family protein n=1 Tax=Microbacterium protaetiae TaxID=2509458 RepID=A0A4P6ED46_9MICO|nr:histidine phosphatase family protein [Microbacterium protaetiae]QAY59606.1 histidine phosphatase family protein [Microbacterium protaetiae]